MSSAGTFTYAETMAAPALGRSLTQPSQHRQVGQEAPPAQAPWTNAETGEGDDQANRAPAVIRQRGAWATVARMRAAPSARSRMITCSMGRWAILVGTAGGWV